MDGIKEIIPPKNQEVFRNFVYEKNLLILNNQNKKQCQTAVVRNTVRPSTNSGRNCRV